MEQKELPPINPASALLSVQPMLERGDGSPAALPVPPTLAFDTFDLEHALSRGVQASSSSGGLRRAISAPHSMNTLGQPNTANSEYLPPSGGPMRRVASSLGMRRSSSFFWTPSAHHDFEQAVASLTAGGTEVSAAAIMRRMSPHEGLRVQDVDKHLKKTVMVQRRIMQQLNVRSGSTGNPSPPMPAVGLPGAMLAGAPGSRMGVPSGGVRMGIPSFGGGGTMAAVAEEPASQPSVAESAELAAQFNVQKAQHLQFAAAREGLVQQVEGQLREEQASQAQAPQVS